MLATIDTTKLVQAARDRAVVAETEMFAAFARLQLDVQATHSADWTPVSVRNLEEKIDAFKNACQRFRGAKDAIIIAMSKGSDRLDSAVPSPNQLDGKIPPGWKSATQDGVPVLVPDSTPSAE